MSKLKKIIIIFLIIVFILIIVLLGFIYLNRGETIYGVDEIGSDEELYNIDTSLQLVDNRNNFYAVKTCIEKFYNNYSSIFDVDSDNNDEYFELSVDEIKKESEAAVYDMLDIDYINYKSISKNNVSKKLKAVKYSVVNINKMYVSQKTANIYVYIVQGTLREIKSGEISDFKIIVKIDALNKTFKVLLEDYVDENYNDIKIGDSINIDIDDEIEKNNTNIYDYEIITDEQYVTDLFAKYKEEVLFDTENAYYHLDEEYRSKKFGTVDDYKAYLRDNIKKNVIIKLNKYQKNVYDNYTEYVCLDQYNNYYIFNEKSIMNYSLLLDTYTVNTHSFIQKYDQGDEQLKVGMNIEKIIDAINGKDYNYVYNKLDETYRKNNFNNIDEFELFIENNFYDYNIVKYETFNIMGNVYTYTLQISDQNEENTKNITVITKLLEDRDFIISFNKE